VGLNETAEDDFSATAKEGKLITNLNGTVTVLVRYGAVPFFSFKNSICPRQTFSYRAFDTKIKKLRRGKIKNF